MNFQNEENESLLIGKDISWEDIEGLAKSELKKQVEEACK